MGRELMLLKFDSVGVMIESYNSIRAAALSIASDPVDCVRMRSDSGIWRSSRPDRDGLYADGVENGALFKLDS